VRSKSAIVRATVRSLRTRGYWAEAMPESMRRSGAPDVLVIGETGFAAFLVVVPPDERPTERERQVIVELRSAAVTALVSHEDEALPYGIGGVCGRCMRPLDEPQWSDPQPCSDCEPRWSEP
jgi:hypothetical protein